MRTARWSRTGIAVGVLAAACTSLPPPSGVSYTGRFTLTVDGVDRRQSASGHFALGLDRSEVTLDLSTPLGATVARLQSGPDGARLTVPSGGSLRTVQGPDPDALSQQVLGWPLPVSGIGDWIEGRPASGRPYRWDTAGDGSRRLEQDGWTIRFEEDASHGHVRRIDMNRAPNGDSPAVSLRIVLDATTGP